MTMENPCLLAFVALGSNLGDSPRVLLEAMDRLEDLSATAIHRSSLWRSSPVDCPPGSPEFVNAVVGLEPEPGLTPEGLLDRLQNLEREFGRRPKREVNEPRPLDLDLLTFRDHTLRSARLVLPHPRAHLRRFVLEPLTELAPGLVLPGQSGTVRSLLDRLETNEHVSRLRLSE